MHNNFDLKIKRFPGRRFNQPTIRARLSVIVGKSGEAINSDVDFLPADCFR